MMYSPLARTLPAADIPAPNCVNFPPTRNHTPSPDTHLAASQEPRSLTSTHFNSMRRLPMHAARLPTASATPNSCANKNSLSAKFFACLLHAENTLEARQATSSPLVS
jgi:hypothetical protein